MKRLVKMKLVIFATVFCYSPLIFMVIAKNFLSPEGFWQKTVFFGAGIYFLGGLQFTFLIIWLVALYVILHA